MLMYSKECYRYYELANLCDRQAKPSSFLPNILIKNLEQALLPCNLPLFAVQCRCLHYGCSSLCCWKLLSPSLHLLSSTLFCLCLYCFSLLLLAVINVFCHSLPLSSVVVCYVAFVVPQHPSDTYFEFLQWSSCHIVSEYNRHLQVKTFQLSFHTESSSLSKSFQFCKQRMFESKTSRYTVRRSLNNENCIAVQDHHIKVTFELWNLLWYI